MIWPVGRHIGPPSIALLHFDGTNGSTSFPDKYSNTWTAHAGAQLSTAQQKFGTASLALNGSTDYISTPITPFQFGNSDSWTIECFIRQTTAGGSQVVYGDDSLGLLFFLNGNPAVLTLLYAAPSAWTVSLAGTTAISTGAWHHIAAVKTGPSGSSVFKLYLDGVQDATTTVALGTPTYGTIQYIGQAANASFFNGFIDEWRVSKVARYTANFTPPSSPFSF